MKAVLSVLAVLAILGFLVWQKWDGEGSANPGTGGSEIGVELETPLSTLSAPVAFVKPESEVSSDIETAEAVDRTEEVRQLSHSDFAREIAGGDVFGVLRQASAALIVADDGPERDRYLSDVLSRSDRLLLSRRAHPEASFEHVVAGGDTIDRLTRRWKKERGLDLTPEFVLKVNGISDPRRLVLGQRLRIVIAAPSLHVSKSRHRLDYLLGEVIVREYRVGLGKDDKTPEGTFSIASRLDSPVWFNAGESIPFGDPRNILGTRWLGFENRADLVGFGIHGTNDETTIGRDLSNGCVRMRNRDVEELFDLVPIGARIAIVR